MNTSVSLRNVLASLWRGSTAQALPAAREISALLSPMLSRSDMADAQTILIIDEIPSNLVLLNSLLGRRYRIQVADSATEGLLLAMSAHQPDLILLEASMSGMDGFTVCEMLQQNSNTRHIPIMFLSNLHSKDAFNRGISLGAVDFICKPVPGFKLIERISRYFSEYAWVQNERRFARGY